MITANCSTLKWDTSSSTPSVVADSFYKNNKWDFAVDLMSHATYLTYHRHKIKLFYFHSTFFILQQGFMTTSQVQQEKRKEKQCCFWLLFIACERKLLVYRCDTLRCIKLDHNGPIMAHARWSKYYCLDYLHLALIVLK